MERRSIMLARCDRNWDISKAATAHCLTLLYGTGFLMEFLLVPAVTAPPAPQDVLLEHSAIIGADLSSVAYYTGDHSFQVP